MNIKVKTKEILDDINQKGFFHLLSANVFIQIVSFASQLLVAWILNPDDLGRIKIIQTLLSVFSIFGGFGLNTSTLKLVSENRSKAEKNEILRVALRFTIFSTIALYLVILLLNVFHIFSSDQLITALIPLGLFPLITNSVFIVYTAYYQGTKNIKLFSKLTVSNKIISIALIILLTYWFGIKGYYIGLNIGFIIILIFIFFKSDMTHRIGKSDTNFLSLHWKYAKPGMFSNIFAELSGYVDILIINYMINDMHEIGQYSFALTLTIALRIFPSTVQQITSPFFSGFNGTRKQLMTIFNKYNRILLTIILLTLIVSLILCPFVLHLFFGSKYHGAVFYFNILAIGWSIRAVNQLQSGVTFGLGKVKYNAYAAFISLIVNLILYPVFIKLWGLTGAAYVSIISGIVIVTATHIYFRKAVKSLE